VGSRRKAPLLSGRDCPVEWEKKGTAYHVRWGGSEFVFGEQLAESILEDFFGNEGQWYPLGANMTEPTDGGLGQFISRHSALTPRHASAVAAILVAEGVLEHRGHRPIELRRVREKGDAPSASAGLTTPPPKG